MFGGFLPALLATPTPTGLAILTNPRFNSDSPDSGNAQPQPHVDVERFRAELREAGIEEMIGDLLDTFLQDAPARLATLEGAIRSGDPKTIQTAAHAFKSGAGTVRASALADMLSRAEAAGRTNHLESLGELMEQIRAEHLVVLQELEVSHLK
jgi:HPt (histidine-containing phosphotransfer) domain-containing protein